MNGKCIYNANIVLADKVIYGYLAIKNGRIEAIREGSSFENQFKKYEKQDASSLYVLPGMIDMVNNSIEKELEEVIHNQVLFNLFFNELEKKLSFSGITTVFHSLSHKAVLRNPSSSNGVDLIGEINRRKGKRHMLNHRVHLKYDTSSKNDINKVIELVQSRSVQFISLSNKSNIDLELTLSEQSTRNRQRQQQINLSHMLQHSKANKVSIAVHLEEDSYIMPAVSYNQSLISILNHSENIQGNLAIFHTAMYSLALQSLLDNGLPVYTNKSIIFSDGHALAMLPAVFKLGKMMNNLPKAITMATLNPAKALGIDNYLGSIEEGKIADLVLVEIYDNLPLVKETFLNGRRVMACDYFE